MVHVSARTDVGFQSSREKNRPTFYINIDFKNGSIQASIFYLGKVGF